MSFTSIQFHSSTRPYFFLFIFGLILSSCSGSEDSESLQDPSVPELIDPELSASGKGELKEIERINSDEFSYEGVVEGNDEEGFFNMIHIRLKMNFDAWGFGPSYRDKLSKEIFDLFRSDCENLDAFHEVKLYITFLQEEEFYSFTPGSD